MFLVSSTEKTGLGSEGDPSLGGTVAFATVRVSGSVFVPFSWVEVVASSNVGLCPLNRMSRSEAGAFAAPFGPVCQLGGVPYGPGEPVSRLRMGQGGSRVCAGTVLASKDPGAGTNALSPG